MISLGNISVLTNIDQSHKMVGAWFYPTGDTYKAGMVQAGDKIALNADLVKQAIANAKTGKPLTISGSGNHVYIFNGQ